MRHDHGTHRRCCFLPISMVLVFSVVVLVALLTPASAQTLGAPFPGLLPPPGVSTAPSVYSALLDFQAGWVTGENPYGVWSYGGSWGLTGPLVLFQEHWTDSDQGFLQQWAEPSVFGGESEDAGVPHVSRNWSYDYDDGNVSWAAGRLALHPGVNYAYAHLIFTAPSGGVVLRCRDVLRAAVGHRYGRACARQREGPFQQHTYRHGHVARLCAAPFPPSW